MERMKFWVLFHHLVGNEGFGKSFADRRELKIRERREMGEKRYNFRIYYFIMKICYFNE